jgi:hypothetical protein
MPDAGFCCIGTTSLVAGHVEARLVLPVDLRARRGEGEVPDPAQRDRLAGAQEPHAAGARDLRGGVVVAVRRPAVIGGGDASAAERDEQRGAGDGHRGRECTRPPPQVI